MVLTMCPGLLAKPMNHAAGVALYVKLVIQLLQLPMGAEVIVCMLNSYASMSGFGRPEASFT